MYKIEAKKHKLLKAYTGTRMRCVYVTEDGNALACLDGAALVSVELTSDVESGWYSLSAGSIIEKIGEECVNKFPTDFFETAESWEYVLSSGGYIEAVTASIRALDDNATINPALIKPFYDYTGDDGASLLKNNGNLFFAEAPGCKLIFAIVKL